MTRPAICVSADKTIREALMVMREKNIRHLPVTAGESQKILGVITYADIRTAYATLETESTGAETPLLSDISLNNPITVHPDLELTSAVKTMLKHRIHCLPVIENGEIIGIVTDTDIMRAFAEICGESV
jgi:acetoin utilization protein AcuB